MLKKLHLSTGKEGFYDVTNAVRHVLREYNVSSGICVVFCPHTTAGMTINEDADPDVTRDLILAMGDTFHDRSDFRHAEGNSHAHWKSMMTGSSVTVIIDKGELVLGTWQGIYFVEYDGPRQRSYYVKIIEEI